MTEQASDTSALSDTSVLVPLDPTGIPGLDEVLVPSIWASFGETGLPVGTLCLASQMPTVTLKERRHGDD